MIKTTSEWHIKEHKLRKLMTGFEPKYYRTLNTMLSAIRKTASKLSIEEVKFRRKQNNNVDEVIKELNDQIESFEEHVFIALLSTKY